MTDLNRRNLLRTLLAGLVSAGSVILARAVPHGGDKARGKGRKQPGPEERADRLASEATPQTAQQPTAFLNRGWRNGSGGGGFRNGAWRNGGGGWGGGFRNGGFANGGYGGGGFRNGAWRNW